MNQGSFRVVKMSKKSKAFELFNQGYRPGDKEVKALGLKSKTTYNYYQLWKKSGPVVITEDVGDKESQRITGDSQTSNVPQVATLMKFIPQTVVCPLTPIMLSARHVAQNEWGWPDNMPWENFLDTVLYLYYKACGITLQGYIIDQDVEGKENGTIPFLASPDKLSGDGGTDINDMADKIALKVISILEQMALLNQ